VPNGWETRLAWASRSWEAEVENAQRLSTRMNIVLTVALAAAAAGTKVLGDALAIHPTDHGRLALLWAAIGGVVCVFASFVRVLFKQGRSGRTSAASFYLLPPEDAGEVGPAGADPDFLKRAFLATSAAAYDLYARNTEEKRRLDQAQQALVLGAALTLLSGALYTWDGSRSWHAPGGSPPWQAVNR
jgi:hypothetical protein